MPRLRYIKFPRGANSALEEPLEPTCSSGRRTYSYVLLDESSHLAARCQNDMAKPDSEAIPQGRAR